MPLHAIEVDPADTYYSIRHRLLWGTASPDRRRRAALLLPAHGSKIREIDLVLLQRLADRERLDIGLVTTDREIIRQARALGLPVFPNLALAEHFRPGWWRAGRKPRPLGFAPGQDHLPPAEPAPHPAGIHALRALILLLAAVLILTGLALTAGVAIPTATLRIRSRQLPVQVITDFTADPALTETVAQILPARQISLDQPWEATSSATGDTAEDRRRIVEEATRGLTAAAPDLLAAELEPDERLITPSVRVNIIDETFDSAGELSLNARLEGLAVRKADLQSLVLPRLTAALPAGYAADPTGVQLGIEPGDEPLANDFRVTATTVGRASIDPAALADLLRGQPAADAARYLSTAYQLAEPPYVDIRPSWWWGASRGRLPYRADRIHIEVLP